MGLFVFFMIIIVFPLMFLTIVGGDDSSTEEALVIHTPDEDMISEALNCEKEYEGNWIDYLLTHYILFEYDFDNIKASNMHYIGKWLSRDGYKKLLGEKGSKLYEKLRIYYYIMYNDLAEIKKEKRVYLDENGIEQTEYVKVIDYNCYFPIPKNYSYTHYDDFGASRSYGGDRHHMGNDIMAEEDTPLVAVTSGRIENLGWNEFGGWRIGIRDHNGRYWYYGHLEGYEKNLYKGKIIRKGDVIGYVGDTGYGPKGTEGKFEPHLHIQLGVEFPNESKLTWINPYGILEFMSKNKKDLDEDED